MHVSQTQPIEGIHEFCSLKLRDRVIELETTIRIYQDYAAGIPTLKHADGKFANLPQEDAAFAMMDRTPLRLNMKDGRGGKVLITDLEGRFTLTGPLE